jgi:peptidoglycan/LPS O-acetylase OafA/YrhL
LPGDLPYGAVFTMTSFEKSEALSATKHLPHPKYRADIDGLRAIAVLAVIIFHAFPSKLRGGFVGVDIFFVISGFLISSIIIGGLERGTFSFSEFYSRRVNRIFPALIAVLAAVWAFSWFGLFPGEFEQLGKHMAGGAAFISNFLLLGEAGYFDSSAETKVLLHLWSLGVEEQFYLIWPIILWLAWKIRFSIPATIAIFMAASFALNIYSVNIDPTEAFYSPQARFWELLIGASLAYFSSFSSGSHPAVSTKLKSIISVIAFILILLSIKSISKKYMFPGWWALIPAISAAAIIYAGPHAWVNRKILSSRVMVFIGLISFPLYLWHWPLLVLARVIEGDTPSRNIRVAMLLISIFLAWVT